MRPVASDTAVGGHFFFRDTLSATMQFSIIGHGVQFPGTFVDLWTAPGSYTVITGNGCNIRTWKYDNDVPEQQNVNAMSQATRADWEIVGNSMIEERKWFDVLAKNRDNDSICQQARQKVDSICKKNNLLRERIVVKEMEVLNQMPVSSWWLSVMEKYAPMIQFAPDHPVIPYLLEAAGKMTDSDRQTPSGKVIMSYVNLPEAVSVGDDMADGDLYDIDGNLHHLSELKVKSYAEYLLSCRRSSLLCADFP